MSESGAKLLGGVSVKAVAAELLGMAVFILIATGTFTGLSEFAVSADATFDKGVHTIGSALAFGSAITALMYATAHTSGGQFNPAVTLGLVGSGALSLPQGVANIVAQILGAILGSAVLYGVIPSQLNDASGLGANLVPSVIPAGSAFLAETCGTTAIVLTYLEVTNNPRSRAGSAAPLAVGFMYLATHLLIIPVTTCGLNPARSLGVAIVAEEWGGKFWVFIVAPLFATLVATAVHLFLRCNWDTVDTGDEFGGARAGEVELLLQDIADRLGVRSAAPAHMKSKMKEGGNAQDSVV